MKNLVNKNLDDFLFEKESIPKTKKEKNKKFEKVMHHWKKGEQHIGTSKKKVPKTERGRKQAIAIGLSSAGLSQNK